MTLVDDLAAAAPPGDSYLTIGVFDGVHLGHRHLMTLLRKKAAAAGCLAGVLTFRNNPLTVLRPDVSIPTITTVEERVRLMRQIGIDFVVPVTFTPDVSRITAEEFVALLHKHLRMRCMVIGPDFALGHRRQGTPEVLKELGERLGFSVTVAEPFTYESERVSSTTIRSALAQGDIQTAVALLGRRFTLEGRVVRGKGRGTNLGYPTANIEAGSGIVVPGDGIYATWAYIGGRGYKAASSIGVRPTFGAGQRTVEAFVLDFIGDLYNKAVRLEFVQRLRDEVAFGSAEELQKQISLDVEQVRRVLEG